MKKITDSDFHIEPGTKVLVRASLNAPFTKGRVTDTFRLDMVVPTITYLQERGASVIIIGHLGRDGYSMRKVSDIMQFKNFFIPHIEEQYVRPIVDELCAGDVIMLENLRMHKGEESNDPLFAKYLASLADIFVFDAFDVAHREHASVVGIPQHIPSYAGLRFANELTILQEAFDPPKGSVCVMGGAKTNTKIPLIDRLRESYSFICTGGVLANTLLAARGISIGASSITDADIIPQNIIDDPKVLAPVDARVMRLGHKENVEIENILPTDIIYDIGVKTEVLYGEKIAQAPFVIWNGPMGFYESKWNEGTFAIARAIAHAKKSFVGGGDTLAVLDILNIKEDMTFFSTGGASLLKYLQNHDLPAIAALEDRYSA